MSISSLSGYYQQTQQARQHIYKGIKDNNALAANVTKEETDIYDDLVCW